MVIKSGPHPLTGIQQLLLAEYNCFFLLDPGLSNWPQRTKNTLMIQTICSMTVYWHVIIHFASLFMLLLTFILKRLLRNIFSLSSDLSCAQSETVWWKRGWNWPKGWRTRWWENLWRCEQRELWTPAHKNKFQLPDYNLLFVLYLPHIILTSVTAMEILCYLLQVAVRQLL